MIGESSARAQKPKAKAEVHLAKLEVKSLERQQRAEEKTRLAEEKALQRAQKKQEQAAQKAARAAAKAAARAAAKAAAKAKAVPRAPVAKTKVAVKAASKTALPSRRLLAAAKRAAARTGSSLPREPGSPDSVAPHLKRRVAAGARASLKRRRGAAQDGDCDDELEDGEDLAEGMAALAEQALGGRSAVAQDRAAWVAGQASLEVWRVAGAAKLFQEGNTLPFIARYRKEKTGSMDEGQLRLVERCLCRADALETRRVRVTLALHKQEALTSDIQAALLGATVMEEIEDIWAPFKAKRQTRAQVARGRGLEPLAELIEQLGAGHGTSDPSAAAERFVNRGLGVEGAKEALAGARDIVAERCAHRSDIKQHSRQRLEQHVVFTARRRDAADEEGQYRTYWNFDAPLPRVKPYQYLAAQRGEAVKALSVGFSLPGDVVAGFVESLAQTLSQTAVARGGNTAAWRGELRAAAQDAFKRLILPSLEREWRRRLKECAEDDAFDTYRRNLYAKLMLPPLRIHPEWGEACRDGPVVAVLGIDPAYRTGCKLALIATTSQVLATKTVYPHPPHKDAPVPRRQAEEAAAGLQELLAKGLAQDAGESGGGSARLLCSIGNGTASRETEAWLRRALCAIAGATASGGTGAGAAVPLASCVGYSVVDEAGASIYSASPLAVKELPALDVSMRGAVSIARRLLDPLSELVKIDPQSIGVGLYQHDVDQKRLAKELKGSTESCVNAVGADLNTASLSLLEHVAGLSKALALAVVAHREEHGPFASRQALLRVRGLGQKVFHQAAGFLRVHHGPEPLDALPVHPESYAIARALQQRCGARAERLAELGGVEALALALDVGVETLADIAAALAGTATDPRKCQPTVRVKPGLAAAAAAQPDNGAAIDAQEAGLTIETLQLGMRLEGVVRNVVAFGAFVDVGVGHDGLLHVSEYEASKRGSATALHVNDRVEVRVTKVERQGRTRQGKDKWRLGLSMREAPAAMTAARHG